MNVNDIIRSRVNADSIAIYGLPYERYPWLVVMAFGFGPLIAVTSRLHWGHLVTLGVYAGELDYLKRQRLDLCDAKYTSQTRDRAGTCNKGG